MADSDAPDMDEYYRLKVKMPADPENDPGGVQAYLTELADNINASDDVSIVADATVPVSRDADGAWAVGTMAIPVNLGCGSKKPDDGDDDGGGDDDDVPS
jgi:hypothetical protein